MKRHPFSRNDMRRSKPWLLLLVLPYLLLGITGSAHFHGIVEPASSHVAQHQLAGSGPGVHNDDALGTRSVARTHIECFACLWAHSSLAVTGSTSSSASFDDANLLFTSHTSPSSHGHTRHGSIRGPPSLVL
ncbi:MAG TPA: hypothetical protein VF719_07725 [Abditibacteriaceae bacterium]|jgi:hypothetical protein